ELVGDRVAGADELERVAAFHGLHRFAPRMVTNWPPRYRCIERSSPPGLRPVVAPDHTPTPFGPPDSAFVIRTTVSLGTVLMAWLSTSNPKRKPIAPAALWKSVSVWCIGGAHPRVRDCWLPWRKLDW